MGHPLVAVELTVRRGEHILTGLTQSPRGTRIRFKTLTLGSEELSKEEFQSNLADAYKILKDELPNTG